MHREQTGLFEAMDFFKLQKGIIITYNQHDIILQKDKRIEVMPVYKWLMINA